MSMNIIDYNNDGVVDEADSMIYSNLIKSKSQLILACISLISTIIVVFLMCTEYVALERIKALETILEFFFVINGTIVGAWFGLDSWMTISKKSN